jgi:O-methyltransferase involved in polyketide biosynthesis
MYLPPEQALGMIAQCTNRFRSDRIIFDLPSIWFGKVSRHGLRTSLRGCAGG